MAAKQENMARAPEGFRRAGSVANAGWFNMSKIGNIIHGTLEGMFRRPDSLKGPNGESDFFQIKASEPCEVRVGNGDAAKLVQAKVGDFVNLNFGPKTKCLKEENDKVSNGAVIEIWGVIAGNKIALKDGRKMHDLDLHIKQIRAPRADMDEVPFDGDDADQAANE